MMRWADRLPILNERDSAAPFDAHYIYHTAWAARILAETRPQRHVDISSIMYFGTILSAFIPVDYFEFRPVTLSLSNYTGKSCDLTALPFRDMSIESLSCMHVVEHVGLGRYGDHLDPDGDLKSIEELKRVLCRGGSLLFVVPVGQPLIVFNAHRIYSFGQVVSNFQGYTLRQFALIDDKGSFDFSATEHDADRQHYGCGCFHFIKD